jgi:hypothetical protein
MGFLESWTFRIIAIVAILALIIVLKVYRSRQQ